MSEPPSKKQRRTLQSVKTDPMPKLKPQDEVEPPKKKKPIGAGRRGVKRKVGDTSDDHERENYTIVTGLNAFMNDDTLDVDVSERNPAVQALRAHRSAMRRTIEADVREVTAVMYELSPYLHFIFRKVIEDGKKKPKKVEAYFKDLKLNSFRNFVFEVQGKEKFPRDAEYAQLRNELTGKRALPESYDTLNRKAIFQQASDQFHTSFKNNIKVNMPRRLMRFFLHVPDNDGKKLSFKEAWAHVRGLLKKPFPFDDRLQISFKGLSMHPFNFIPFLYKLQRVFEDKGVKSFVVVPQNKAQPKFVHYTNTALSELTARFSVEAGQDTPSAAVRRNPVNCRSFWQLFFNVRKFESEANGKRFEGLLTNGVQANVLMSRPKNPEVIKVVDTVGTKDQSVTRLFKIKSVPVPRFDTLIAYDPGMRLVLAGVKVEVQSGRVKEFRLSSRQYHHENGNKGRRLVHMWLTGDTEQRIDKVRVERGELTQASEDYKRYVRFVLDYANVRLKLYSDVGFRKLALKSYIDRRAFMDNYVRELCPPGRRTAVFNGTAKMPPFIKGYAKASLRGFEAAFDRLPHVTLFPTDEFRTTALCHLCHARLIVPTSNRKERSRYCVPCRQRHNRDINAAYNILRRGLGQHFSQLGHVIPQNMQRAYTIPVPAVVDDDEEEFGLPEEIDSDYISSDDEDDAMESDAEDDIEAEVAVHDAEMIVL